MQLFDRRFFALLGEVVDGNPTEEMMQAAFGTAGLAWKYISVAVSPDRFAEAFQAARRLGFAGLHITKPFKIAAAGLVDQVTPAATKIGAVNCVYLSDGVFVGDNTDGRGLVNAVGESCRVDGAVVVVLGSGGAARAVAVELALAGAHEITIVSRSEPQGRSLVDALALAGHGNWRYAGWSDQFLAPSDADLVVNATSVGMIDPSERPRVDLSGLRESAVVADVVIAPRPTRFLADARRLGLRTVGGVEMLVKQAAISFELWSGLPADESVLREALVDAMPLETP